MTLNMTLKPGHSPIRSSAFPSSLFGTVNNTIWSEQRKRVGRASARGPTSVGPGKLALATACTRQALPRANSSTSYDGGPG